MLILLSFIPQLSTQPFKRHRIIVKLPRIHRTNEHVHERMVLIAYAQNPNQFAESEGGRESESPTLPLPEKITKYRFLSNTGQDTLKNHKTAKPAFKFGSWSVRAGNAQVCLR